MNLLYISLRSLKQNIWRNIAVAVCIALGTALILSLAGELNAVVARHQRTAWLAAIYQHNNVSPKAGVDPLLVNLQVPNNLDVVNSKTVYTLSVHQTGPNAPKVAGLVIPPEGKCIPSKALKEAALREPSAHIAQRFSFVDGATLSSQMLAGPEQMRAVCGITHAQAEELGAQPMFFASSKMNMVTILTMTLIAIGSIGVLIPALLLTSTAMRLGSAQREQRYAAIRLVGGTQTQVRNLLCLESLVGSLVGVIGGTLLFFAIRAQIAKVHVLSDVGFFVSDVTLKPTAIVALCTSLIALSLLVTMFSVRNAITSPLGTTRRAKNEGPLSILRVVPLLAGCALLVILETLGYVWARASANASVVVLLFGLVLLTFSVGLIAVGPYIAQRFARLAKEKTKRVTTFLALSTVGSNPRRSFRTVAGLVVALYMGSLYVSMAAAVHTEHLAIESNEPTQQLRKDVAVLRVATTEIQSASLDANNATDNSFKLIPAYAIKPSPNNADSEDQNNAGSDDSATVAMKCSDWKRVIETNCSLNDWYKFQLAFTSAASASLERVNTDSVDLNKKTAYFANATPPQVDALRSQITNQLAPYGGIATPDVYFSMSRNENAGTSDARSLVDSLLPVVYIGIAVTALLATASLLLSLISGALERRRTLLTLRLSGMTSRELQTAVLKEALIPLWCSALFAAACGLATGYVFFNTLSRSYQVSLDFKFLGFVLGSLVVTSAFALLVIPTINTVTNVQTNRTE